MCGAEICIHGLDAPGLTDPSINLSMMFGERGPDVLPDIILSDGDEIGRPRVDRYLERPDPFPRSAHLRLVIGRDETWRVVALDPVRRVVRLEEIARRRAAHAIAERERRSTGLIGVSLHAARFEQSPKCRRLVVIAPDGKLGKAHRLQRDLIVSQVEGSEQERDGGS